MTTSKRLTMVPEIWARGVIPNVEFIDGPGEGHRQQMSDADIGLASLYALARLVRDAATSSTFGYSWRMHNVGAAVFAYDRDSDRSALLTGHNVKPNPGDGGSNIHAEQMALEKVRMHGLSQIFALAVWGPTQPDHQSGREALTAHPCGLCRNNVLTEPEFTDHTTIVSTTEDFSVCELYNRRELTLYHEGIISSLPKFSLSDRSLTELVIQTNGRQLWQTDYDYDARLSLLLLDRWSAFFRGNGDNRIDALADMFDEQRQL